MDKFHTSVLLSEAIDNLHIQRGKTYIDATLGGGGYTFRILELGGRVLALDQDIEAIEWVQEKLKVKSEKLKVDEENIILVHGNFRELKRIAKENGVEQVDGIVFDLGVSSFQMDKSQRGFSFAREEELDMRMNPSPATAGSGQVQSITADDIVNRWSEEELYDLFSKKGEEHFAREIAKEIVEQRPIKSTRQLAELAKKVVLDRRLIHPATKIFQALRIEVNQELEALEQALDDGFKLLSFQGRMVVVSFHSLEDRIVKQHFKKWVVEKKGIFVVKKPLTATDKEIEENRRSRSAKLRAIEKI